MNKERYVFAQLISFLNEDKFRRIVDKYQGNRYVKHFTCWNQLLALMFGQLSNRESLRDLIVALDATTPNVIIWEWVRMSQNHLWQEPTEIETTASLKSLHTIW